MANTVKPGLLGRNYAGILGRPRGGLLAIADLLDPEPDYASELARFSVLVEPAPKRSIRFEVYKDDRNEWRWTLKAANGRTFGDSGEGYKNRADMMKMIDEIRGAIDIPVVERKPLARINLSAFSRR